MLAARFAASASARGGPADAHVGPHSRDEPHMHTSASVPDLPSTRCFLVLVHVCTSVPQCRMSSLAVQPFACALACCSARAQKQHGHGSAQPVSYGLFGCTVEQVRQRLQPDLVAEHAGFFKVRGRCATTPLHQWNLLPILASNGPCRSRQAGFA